MGSPEWITLDSEYIWCLQRIIQSDTSDYETEML